MPARVCGRPGCPELTPCPQHPKLQPQGWTQRPSTRNRTRPSDASERRRLVHQRDEGVCYWCGSSGARTVDHVLAVSDGGSWELDNLACIHVQCHREKTRIEQARRKS